MMFQGGKFSLLVLCLEVAFIIIYAFFVKYSGDAEGPKINSTAKNADKRNSIQDYYASKRVSWLLFLR